MSRCLPITALALALSLAFPRAAFAQAGDASAATELFRQGREALDTKDYATACSKFEESMRLDPHVGTLISLAECEEASGKLARARAHWQQAVDFARSVGDKREAFAAEKLRLLDPRVPRLTLRSTPGLPPDLAVWRDELDIGSASFDTPLPVEVGHHTVTVYAAGYGAKKTTVDLKEGETKEVLLEPGPPLPPAPASEAPAPPPPAPPPPVMPEAPARPSPLRPIAVATGGLGVVALGVGAYLGIQVLQAKSQPAGSCTSAACDSNASARQSALREGDAADVAFASGGVLLATAAVLWFLAPGDPPKKADLRVRPGIGPTALGLTVEGAF